MFLPGARGLHAVPRAVPGIVQNVMDRFAAQTGRAYHLFDYYGAPDAERVIVLMGSGAEAAEEAVDALNKQGEKLGMVKVRLYRPFDAKRFLPRCPATVKSIAVLDRCKEPGGAGEPLYQDIMTVLARMPPPAVCGKPGDWRALRAVVEGIHAGDGEGHLRRTGQAAPKNHFTIGINDDVSHTSLDYDPEFSTEDPKTVRALFYGLGSDGTVGANKNSIKIIGSETPNYAQGYFVYDSKKSGSMTTSHLRFGPNRSGRLPDYARQLCGLPQLQLPGEDGRAGSGHAGRGLPAQLALSAAEVWDKLPRPRSRRCCARRSSST
jgi:pyruvate-ferredoxin/flavodoxin oxidoreductase